MTPEEGIALDCPKRRSWRAQEDSVGACARLAEPRGSAGAWPGRTAKAVGLRAGTGHAGATPGPVNGTPSGNDNMRNNGFVRSKRRARSLDRKSVWASGPLKTFLTTPARGRAAHSISLCHRGPEGRRSRRDRPFPGGQDVASPCGAPEFCAPHHDSTRSARGKL